MPEQVVVWEPAPPTLTPWSGAMPQAGEGGRGKARLEHPKQSAQSILHQQHEGAGPEPLLPATQASSFCAPSHRPWVPRPDMAQPRAGTCITHRT